MMPLPRKKYRHSNHTVCFQWRKTNHKAMKKLTKRSNQREVDRNCQGTYATLALKRLSKRQLKQKLRHHRQGLCMVRHQRPLSPLLTWERPSLIKPIACINRARLDSHMLTSVVKFRKYSSRTQFVKNVTQGMSCLKKPR